MKVKSLSRVRLFATPWTAAYQALPSMGFFQARVLEWDAIAFSINAGYTCSIPGECESCTVVSNSATPRNSPGQNTGLGSFSLLQRIFSTQGSNPGLLHCRQVLYYLSHQGNPLNFQSQFSSLLFSDTSRKVGHQIYLSFKW